MTFTCVANIMLNEVPNSYDTTCIANNVCLTTLIGHITILNGGNITIMQKDNLLDTRDNDTISRKVQADGNKLCPGKEFRLYPVV